MLDYLLILVVLNRPTVMLLLLCCLFNLWLITRSRTSSATEVLTSG